MTRQVAPAEKNSGGGDGEGRFRDVAKRLLHRPVRRLVEWTRPDVTQETGPRTTVPVLRPLTPAFDDAEHAGYVDHLNESFGHDDLRNIALAGPYGSGKSSILAEFKRRRPGGETIFLYLSTLTAISFDRRDPDANPESVINAIQKEIVKQILYRRPAHRTSPSRFDRIRPFRRRLSVTGAFAVGIVAFLLAASFGTPGRIQPLVWNAITRPAAVAWVLTVAGAALLGLAAYGVLRGAYRGVHLSEAKIGSATITLQAGADTYFDSYLDEIVHFFATTAVRTVIFEDLDRFDEPRIFEALRSLNTVVNSSPDVHDGPVRFVYALRDSIFEPTSGDGPQTNSDAASDRVKFFDIVIPVVPFLSVRASQDLVEAQFADLAQDVRPSPEVLHLVAGHLTDMRLVKNIRNEYAVFASRLLRSDDSAAQRNKLFAMVVYKNLRLADFEHIAFGTSRLDDIYRFYRVIVNSQISYLINMADKLGSSLSAVDETVPNSAELAQRLGVVLKALESLGSGGANGRPVVVKMSRRTVTTNEMSQPEFWLAAERGEVTIHVPALTPRNSSQSLQVSGVDLAHLMDRDLFYGNRHAERERLEAELAETEGLLHYLATASMADLMARDNLTAVPAGAKHAVCLTAYAATQLDSDLFCVLLSKGLIDENFTLYATQYHGRLSPGALRFVLQNVQRNTADPGFRFDDPDIDIPAIAESEGARFLDGNSFFNFQVLDHYAKFDPPALDKPFSRLVAGDGPGMQFLGLYLGEMQGWHKPPVLERLTTLWPEIFQFLLGHLSNLNSAWLPDKLGGLSAAILSATQAPSGFHRFDDQERERLDSCLGELRCFSEPTDPSVAQALATLLGSWGAKASDLSAVAEPQRSALVARSLFRVTRRNIAIVMGGDSWFSLDEVFSAAPGVYEYLLQEIDDYLALFREEVAKTGTRPWTIKGAPGLTRVLKDLQGVSPLAARGVIAGAGPGCVIDDITTVDRSFWPDLAYDRMFEPSFRNIEAYIAVVSEVDSALAKFLNEADAINELKGIEDSRKVAVASAVLSSREVALVKRLDLANGLGFEAFLDPTGIQDDAVLPELVGQRMVADDRAVFTRLRASSWATKRALLVVSKRPAEFLTELCLTSSEITSILDDPLLAPVLAETLVTNAPRWLKVLSRGTATTLARRVLHDGFAIDFESFAVLAQAGADRAVLLRIASPRLAAWDNQGELPTVLAALGGEYAKLAEGKTVEVSKGEPNDAMVRHLKRLGFTTAKRRGKEIWKVTPR
ncbi:MAG: hypothetical protein LBC97_01820 [Bifidobacteriaceae bacterium]|jgi:hypothetical protein|nr:hypothetical protein [Bifidobacteriaceae bacterium]